MLRKLNRIEYLFYFIGTLFLIISLLAYFVVKDATLDIPVHDTYFVINHVAIVLSLCAIYYILGGIYHLSIFLIKRRTIKSLNILHLLLSFLSLLIFFSPLFLVGLPRAPRRYYSNLDTSFIENITDLNFIVQISIYLFIIAQLIFITNIILTLLKKRNENNLL